MSKIKKALEVAQNERNTDYENYFFNDSINTEIKKFPHSEDYDVAADVQIKYTDTKICKVQQNDLNKNLVFSNQYLSGITDKFKLMRSQILKALNKIDGNSLLITSPNPREGKTFTSINLAISLAQEFNRTVLLVDADLKNNETQHSDFAKDFFSLNVKKGLSDYLINQIELSEVLINPGINKLTILPAGKSQINSAEIFGSQRMFKLMLEIKNRYSRDRIVIIDSPSLLSADPVVLSRFTDAVLLVIEHEKTSVQDIQRARDLLEDCRIIGTIINKSKSVKNAYV